MTNSRRTHTHVHTHTHTHTHMHMHACTHTTHTHTCTHTHTHTHTHTCTHTHMHAHTLHTHTHTNACTHTHTTHITHTHTTHKTPTPTPDTTYFVPCPLCSAMTTCTMNLYRSYPISVAVRKQNHKYSGLVTTGSHFCANEKWTITYTFIIHKDKISHKTQLCVYSVQYESKADFWFSLVGQSQQATHSRSM